MSRASGTERKQTLAGLSNPKWRRPVLPKRRTPDNCFFSGFPLVSQANFPRRPRTGQPFSNEAISQPFHPRRTGSAVLHRGACPAAADPVGRRRHIHAASCPPAPRRLIPAQSSSRGHARIPARDAVAFARARHRHRDHRRVASAIGRTPVLAAICLLHPRRRLSRQQGFRVAGDAGIRRPPDRLCHQRFRRRQRPAVVDRAGNGDRPGRHDRSQHRRRGDPSRCLHAGRQAGRVRPPARLAAHAAGRARCPARNRRAVRAPRRRRDQRSAAISACPGRN